jgi:hypothetical protein
MHLMTKGKVRDDIIEYEFGNFKDESKETVKRAMDDFEDTLIKLEAQYNDWSRKVVNLPVMERVRETQQRISQSAEAMTQSLRQLFTAK